MALLHNFSMPRRFSLVAEFCDKLSVSSAHRWAVLDEEQLAAMQRELDFIKQRNAKVEADKAWESSYFRIGSICIITYFVAAALCSC